MFYLDHHCAALRKNLTVQYIEHATRSSKIEHQLWSALFDLTQAFLVAYYAFAREVSHHAQSPKWQQLLPELLCRQIVHMGLDAKIRLYRYEQWIPAKWAELHALFTLACSRQFERAQLPRGDGSGSTTTIEHEYLIALLLQLMNAGNMTARHLEWVAGELDEWCAPLRLSLEPSSVTSFYVDLGARDGLRRRTPAPLEGRVLFLDTRPLHSMLMQNVMMLEQKIKAQPLSDRTPKRTEQLGLLTKLASQVDPEFKPFARRGERTAAAGTVDAIVGFAKISAYLREEEQTARRRTTRTARASAARWSSPCSDARATKPTSRVELSRRRFAQFAAPGGPWEVKDVSQTGFRLLAPMSVANMVTLGTLAAIRPHGQSPWTLGIVRRMKRMTADRAEIGLQVIANTLVGVDLVEQRKGSGDDYSVDGEATTINGRTLPRAVPRAAQARRRFRRCSRSSCPPSEYQPAQAAEAHDVEDDQPDPLRAPARAAARLGVGHGRVGRPHACRCRRSTRSSARPTDSPGRRERVNLRAPCVADRYAADPRGPSLGRPGASSTSRTPAAPAGPTIAARFALYWEDESGATSAHTFWDLAREANRLSNVLARLGVARGDRVALILPQRRETVVAHLAVYQMGAVAVPLSFLFGPDALEYRLDNSGARVALVDPQSLPNIAPIRAKLPRLTHVVGVRRRARRRHPRLRYASSARGVAAVRRRSSTRADDPALIVYTSGTTGPPKGALMPHRCLLGNLPGFVHSHDGYPQPGDLFWSPADWAWTGGLMDALLPTLYFGQPIVGYRGRFDPERALRLMEKYQIRNSFLFPTALKLIMKAFPRPRERFDVNLRTIMSAGEAVGTTVFAWAQEALGVTINEMFGQTEMNYIVGNSNASWPAKPGSMGRPYPGHRVAVIDEDGPRGRARRAGRRRGQPHRARRHARSRVLPRVPRQRGRHAQESTPATGAAPATWRRMDEDGYLWYQGRADDMFKVAGYRVGPSEIENCIVKHPAVANAAVIPVPDETRGNVVKAFVVLAAGHAASKALEETSSSTCASSSRPTSIRRRSSSSMRCR